MLNLANRMLHKKGSLYYVILTLIAFVMSLTLSSCNSKPAVESNESAKINAPVEMNFTVKNPLTTTEHHSGDGNQFSYTYITIEGLLDKEVEKKINDRIKAVYDEMMVQDLPPYRGIKAMIPENAEMVQDNISMSPSGNFNNILSVMVNKYTTYAVPNKDGVIIKHDKNFYENTRYVSEVIGLNFDLNTGEEIALKEVFCDNVDYLSSLNDYMSDFLSSNYADEEGYFYTMNGDLKLVESFKGLSEDQKFVLYPFGISLIFDYDTPQFDTHFMASTPILHYKEFDGNLAITKRFYNEEKNIYENQETLIKSLLQGFQYSDVMGYDQKQEGKINFYTSWSYSSNLPQKIQDVLQGYRPDFQETYANINDKLKDITNQNEFDFIGYECYIYADSISNYINTMKNVYISMPNHYEQYMEYHCFDKDTLEEIKLEDLFKEGFDYKPIIIESIKKGLKEREASSGVSSLKQYSEKEIEDVYNNINGFSLNADEMYIPTGEMSSEGSTYTMSVYIPYAEFGCENMTIFDEKIN